MNIPCANRNYCPLKITGHVDAHFIGIINGWVDVDFTGHIRGFYQGHIVGHLVDSMNGFYTGYLCGTVNAHLSGTFMGTLCGVDFNGPIDQDVNCDICGTFTGTIVGEVDLELDGDFGGIILDYFIGHLRGNFVDTWIDARMVGDVIITFSGTIDGIPTDSDYPYRNLSAELPDVIGGFPFRGFEDDNTPFTFPPTDGPLDGPIDIPPLGVIVEYSNNEQSCTRTCPSLADYTAVVSAGLFGGLTQAFADAAAFALACELADLYCDTGTVQPWFANTPQTCTFTCPTGETNSFTAPVGTYAASTLAAANAVALAHACIMAQLTCSPVSGSLPLPPGGTPPGGGPPPIPPLTPPSQPPTSVNYSNSEQTATIICPNGGTFAYTVKSGLFFGIGAGTANAAALSYARAQAEILQFCLLAYDDDHFLTEVQSFQIALLDARAFYIWIHRSDNPIINEANPMFRFPFTATAVGAPTVNQPPFFFGQLNFGNYSEMALLLLNPAITAGTYPTVFTIFQDRPTYRIRATRTINWYVCEITTTSLPDGVVGTPYLETLAGTGFNPTSIWEIIAGSLPPGLTLNPTTGDIGGTPTESVSSGFTVKRGSCTKEFTVSISAAASSCGWWNDFPFVAVPGPYFSQEWTPPDPEGATVITMDSPPTEPDQGSFLRVLGTKNYTGPAVIIKAIVEVTRIGGPHGIFGGGQCFVFGNAMGAVGTYEWTVEIPESVGVDYPIELMTLNDAAMTITLIDCVSTIGATDGFYLVPVGDQPLFYYAPTGVANPTATITVASNKPITWDIANNFPDTSWAVAPSITLDGVPLTFHFEDLGGGVGNWVCDLATVETDGCVVKTFVISGPTIADPFGLGVFQIVPQS